MKEPDLTKLKRISIRDRKSKVNISHLARSVKREDSLCDFIDSLPDILQAKDLKCLARELIEIKAGGGKVLWMMGGHVVKCGLSPIIIDLMKEGFVDFVAMNGGASIHDFELAVFGETSEDVKEGLDKGMFGVARETAALMNSAISDGCGIGESLCEKVEEVLGEFREKSILWQAYKMGICVTVHTAIGADIIHQHPEMDGSAFGEASFSDFKRLMGFLPLLEGGAVVNLGSAVILPEVFLKALNASRNLTGLPKKFTRANFDMMPTYREIKNVVERTGEGKEFILVGRHEVLIPLFSVIIKCMNERKG
ncbi:hypothetical protein CH333_00900 [candidate division WOR-3 bacterium JGI_Cruoil_03_44_89]|uniref:Arginine dihydrolase ArgZ/ArgE-like C-terminal second subdomain domain-containing protein n=1 Tax=candidate division WOR-3 bacterium JGI_Cruoil_03_44_89 TaxID=1973748 RepID=A0A235BYY7_UNCW3|nr:MAG: hypothetical protein CH333_00900 [candidate division WOR-3 bacterium JGI_Cruoil_03_44_89]